MSQYDIIFAINISPSEVNFQEHYVKLEKGEILVGTNTTPTKLPAAVNDSILVYDSNEAAGLKAVSKSDFLPIGSLQNLLSGQVYTIPQNRQNLIYGDMNINGKLNVLGINTVINGSIEIGADGELDIANEVIIINL